MYCIKQSLPSLKVSKTWRAPVERVYAEIAWLQLAQTIVPGCSPKILGVDSLTHSFVMPFLPSNEFANWKSELMAGRIAPRFAASVGKTIARVHGETAYQEEIKRNFSNDENFLKLRLDPYLLEVARQHPDLAAPIYGLVRRTQVQKIALVHGDMSPKNILVGPAGPVFLDAECACYGDPAFDAAFCLNHLLLKSLAIRNRATLLLEAFDAFVDAYLSGVNWEPRSSIESRIASLLPALMLARISGKSPVEYLDMLQRENVINIAAPLISRPPTELQELKCIWKMGALIHE
jgi:5-methylthioribose kinase